MQNKRFKNFLKLVYRNFFISISLYLVIASISYSKEINIEETGDPLKIEINKIKSTYCPIDKGHTESRCNEYPESNVVTWEKNGEGRFMISGPPEINPKGDGKGTSGGGGKAEPSLTWDPQTQRILRKSNPNLGDQAHEIEKIDRDIERYAKELSKIDSESKKTNGRPFFDRPDIPDHRDISSKPIKNDSKINYDKERKVEKEIKEGYGLTNKILDEEERDCVEATTKTKEEANNQEKEEKTRKESFIEIKNPQNDCITEANIEFNLATANLVTDENFIMFSSLVEELSKKIATDLSGSSFRADQYLFGQDVSALDPKTIAKEFIEEFNKNVNAYTEELERVININANENLSERISEIESLKKDVHAFEVIKPFLPKLSSLTDLINTPFNNLNNIIANLTYKGPEAGPINQINLELNKNAFLDITGGITKRRIQNVLSNTIKYSQYKYLSPHIQNTFEFLRMANEAIERGDEITGLVLATAIEKYNKATVDKGSHEIDEMSAWDMADGILLVSGTIRSGGKAAIQQLLKQLSLNGRLKKRGFKLASDAVLKVASKKVPGKGLLTKASKALAIHEKEIVFKEVLDIIKEYYRPEDVAALIKYASRKIGVGVDDYVKAVDVLGVDEVTRLISKESEEVVDTVLHLVEIGKITSKFTRLPPLRKKYVIEVISLRNKIPAMNKMGMSTEQIARALHAERRALGVKYKNLTSPELREQIYKRNLELYNDKLGPTVEWLRDPELGKKTWKEIIEGAVTPGGEDLSF